MTERLPMIERRAWPRAAVATGFGVLAVAGAGAILIYQLIPLATRDADVRAANAPGRDAGASADALKTPPVVEPVKLVALTPDDARSANLAIPFVTGPIASARPFVFVGSTEDRARATSCLATAVLYEAGDDTVGERAVAQVVLNRVRHPAFPQTVCGVVYQGSNLPTGCQFTFTCDGALARKQSDAAWERARIVAADALAGHVVAGVGTATHYHTDWVFPYWAPSLDKIAQVETHLFYRWKGIWGLPPAFARRYAGGEMADPAANMVVAGDLPIDESLSAPVGGAAGIAEIDGVAAGDLRGAVPRLVDNTAASYVLQLDPAAFPGSYAMAALNICAKKNDCTVVGYTHADRIPAKLPVSSTILRQATFYYRSRKLAGIETVLWNCRDIPRSDPAQCLPGSAPAAPAAAPAPTAP